MKRSCRVRFSAALCSAAVAAVLGIGLAHAESPYERDQRLQLEQYHREHGVSPWEQQQERWKQEWIQQHPGQPVPNLGVLEHLHEGEIIANSNAGFAKMRQARQAQLQWEYQRAKQQQMQALSARHITWSAQQWKEWDRQYDLEKQQQANDYLEAVRQAGEIERDAQRRALGY